MSKEDSSGGKSLLWRILTCECFSKKKESEEEEQNDNIPQSKLVINQPKQKKKIINIITKFDRKAIKVSEFQPQKEKANIFPYNCPLCFRYFNTILKTTCCRNYMCLYCSEKINQRLVNNENLNQICHFCYKREFLLIDVDPKEKIRKYNGVSPFPQDKAMLTKPNLTSRSAGAAENSHHVKNLIEVFNHCSPNKKNQLYLTPLDQSDNELFNNVRLVSEEDERKCLREGLKDMSKAVISNQVMTEAKVLDRKRSVRNIISESVQLTGISKTEGNDNFEKREFDLVAKLNAKDIEKENKDINKTQNLHAKRKNSLNVKNYDPQPNKPTPLEKAKKIVKIASLR